MKSGDFSAVKAKAFQSFSLGPGHLTALCKYNHPNPAENRGLFKEAVPSHFPRLTLARMHTRGDGQGDAAGLLQPTTTPRHTRTSYAQLRCGLEEL